RKITAKVSSIINPQTNIICLLLFHFIGFILTKNHADDANNSNTRAAFRSITRKFYQNNAYQECLKQKKHRISALFRLSKVKLNEKIHINPASGWHNPIHCHTRQRPWPVAPPLGFGSDQRSRNKGND